MNISPAVLGLVRGIGFAVVLAVLTYLGNAVNLAPVLGDTLATLIASGILAYEHALEAKGSGALFGSVNRRVQ